MQAARHGGVPLRDARPAILGTRSWRLSEEESYHPMARGDHEGPREQFRVRVIAFVLVPVLVLGVCYFLLVEYVAVDPDVPLGGKLVGLRLGGAGLITLALVLAVAAGYILADRVVRPIRFLLRFAESGELPAGAGLFVHHRDWEVFLLYRRIQALIQQNRAGAGALDELESLRLSLTALRSALSRTGQHGVFAPLGISEGPCRDIAELLDAHRQRLLAFFRDLRSRTEELTAQVEALEVARVAANGLGHGRGSGCGMSGSPSVEGRGDRVPAGADSVGEVDARDAGSGGDSRDPRDVRGARNVGDPSDVGAANGRAEEAAVSAVTMEVADLVAELRLLGTVISLEIERTRREGEEVGHLYRDFRKAIDRLEELMQSFCAVDDPSAARASFGSWLANEEDMSEAWKRLREDLGSLDRRLEEVEER